MLTLLRALTFRPHNVTPLLEMKHFEAKYGPMGRAAKGPSIYDILYGDGCGQGYRSQDLCGRPYRGELVEKSTETLPKIAGIVQL